MAKFCERCRHAMSAHDNHASCPQCRVAAGVCSTLVIHALPVKDGLGSCGRQSSDGASGETALDYSLSPRGSMDFGQTSLYLSVRNLLPGCTAASTADIQQPIVQQLGHVIQGAQPERKFVSRPYFSGQQYTAASGFTATLPCTAAQPCFTAAQALFTAAQAHFTAAQPQIAPYNNNNMPAMSVRPAEPMGFFGQGGQLPLMLTEEQLLHQQQLLRGKQEFDAWRASRAQAKTQSQHQALTEAEANIEVNVDSSEGPASVARASPQDQVTKQAKAKRAGSTSTPRRSPSPRGTTLGGLAQ